MLKGRLVVILIFLCITASSSSIDSLLNNVRYQSGIEKMNTLISLYDLHKGSDPYKAIDFIKEAIPLAEEGSDPNIKCTVHNKLGNVYTDLGLNFLAMDAYYSALKFAEDSQDPRAVPFSLVDVGNVYYAIGNNERAIEYYRNSLEIFEKQKDFPGMAVAYNNIGLVNINLESYDKALDFFTKAYKIRQEVEGLPELAHSNIYISDAYFNLKQFDKAIEHLQIADELYDKDNNLRSKAIVASRMGDIYMADEKYDLAILKFKQALQVFSELDNYIWTVIENLNLAQAYKNVGNLKQAIASAEKALLKSKENNYSQYLVQLHELLASIFYETGEIDKAYNYRQRLNVISDSIQDVNDNVQFANLQFSVETLKHRLETERLTNEIQKRNILRNYLIVIFILVISVFTLVIGRFRLKRKQEHIWHIQQEEIAALQLREKEDENVKLNRELELRNRELTSKTMGIVKNSEFISEIVKELQELEIIKKENREKVQRIIDRLKHNQKEDGWDEFEIRFEKVHKDFNQKLAELHPSLTPNERRLCALLRLNMTTKEISSITYQSSKSIDVARSRLRKKMKLPREENLICYLTDF